MSETIKIKITSVTHYKEDSGWARARAIIDSKVDNSTVITGILPNLKSGMTLEATGVWENRGYGRQFKVQSFTEIAPQTASDIERYLSGFVKGIGPHMAAQIVKIFGDKTFDVLDNQPERILCVHGIGKQKAHMILHSWNESRMVRRIMSFLSDCGATPNMAMKIYKKYGDESIQKIKENPYCIADDFWGIGFKTADTFALKSGIKEDAPQRIRSGILYALKVSGDKGNTCTPKDSLITAAKSVAVLNLEAREEKICAELNAMLSEHVLYQDCKDIYSPENLRYEQLLAQKIRNHVSQNCKAIKADIPEGEPEKGITYNEMQRLAILNALTNRLSIITGGPGSGKTTILKAILKLYEKQKKDCLLCSPTGKAAKRMTEATGHEASTIHRLLSLGPSGFERNSENPLEGDLLVVDETSMLDLPLAASLFFAVPETMNVVLVGDIDQLPSVGIGQVLKDIIASHVCPVTKLNCTYRQDSTSAIIQDAYLINSGKMPITENVTDVFYREFEYEHITEGVVDTVMDWIPEKFGYKPDEIQVLCPGRKSCGGVYEVNEKLEERLNPNGKTMDGFRFKVNDRVMQLKNRHNDGVYNGDCGVVIGFNEENKTMSVQFDEKVIEYEKQETDELVLSMAMSIHKSQGSEYPVVVCPVSTAHYMLLQRNLLYTAITRAKKIFVFVGPADRKGVSIAVKNNAVKHRYSHLTERIINGTEVIENNLSELPLN